MKRILILLAALLLVGLGLAVVTFGASLAGAATPPPRTLNNEQFIAGTGSQSDFTGGTVEVDQTPDCGTVGPQQPGGWYGGFSASFSSTGQAEGPYPGTYTESGTFSVGTTPRPTDDGDYVTAFQSTFTITSGSYTITGTRTMHDSLGWGLCSPGAFVNAGMETDFTATIKGPEGTFTDSSVTPAGQDSQSSVQMDDEPPSRNEDYYIGYLVSTQSSTTPVASAPPSVYVSDTSVVEGNSGNSQLVFTVSLAAPTTTVVKVSYATADGSATAGSDYTAKTGSVNIPKGSTSATVNVVVKGDSVVEPDETLTLSVTGVTPSTATVGRGTATGKIMNDDVAVTANAGDAGNFEGNAPNSSVIGIPVTLSQAATGLVKVDWTTADGTATAPSDYVAKSGTLTIPAGSTTGIITLKVVSDTVVEPDEAFSVRLLDIAAGPAVIGNATGTATIVNDDANVTASLNDTGRSEGNSGTSAMVFTVSLDNPAPSALKLTYATANGSAVAPGDYAAKSGTVTIAKGASSATISVNVKGDTTVELDETFTITLTGVTSGPVVIGNATATGTIVNDDGLPPPSSTPPPPTAPPGSGTPTAPGSSAPGTGAPVAQ